MVQTPVRQITLEEFLALPETKPASEYIDGQIIQKPMPQGHHSIIQGELLTELTLVLKRNGIATAFPELRCTFGGRAIVPDLAVFENARIPTNAGQIENVFTIAPDWTIEVLSPGQSANKVLKNINHCLAYGTQMGWLIDPEDRSIVISRSDQNLEVIDEPKVVLPVPDFAKSLELTIDRLFGWLTLV
ncbi:MAG: Uma2 family endonuclease [Chamaesiphon sp.]|nr:Uma2 family endonuclease [Chamaesiphon sp.]